MSASESVARSFKAFRLSRPDESSARRVESVTIRFSSFTSFRRTGSLEQFEFDAVLLLVERDRRRVRDLALPDRGARVERLQQQYEDLAQPCADFYRTSPT